MSAKPHTGCSKFSARFGPEALRFVNSPVGRAARLRGLNAVVVEAGTVRVGDTVTTKSPRKHVRVSDSYPRQAARTRTFNLGLPRAFRIADDGSRVVFLRSRPGDDPVAGLWVLDVEEDTEREVFHPAGTRGAPHAGGDRPPGAHRREAERGDVVQDRSVTCEGRCSYRECTDAGGSGDRGGAIARDHAVARSIRGRPRWASGSPMRPEAPPRARPRDGRRRAARRRRRSRRSMGGCRVHRRRRDGTASRALVGARRRRLDRVPRRRSSGAGAAHRVADRARRDARAVRYPQAGTSNAIVTLHVLGIDGLPGRRGEWDRDAFEYVVAVRGPRKVRRWRSCNRAINGTCRCWRSIPTPARPRSSGGTTTTDGRTSPRVCRRGSRATGCSRRATATTRACC